MKKTPKKKKDITCTSATLLLCGDVLKKIHGRMGKEKLKTGMGLNKKQAIFTLIMENGYEPTEQEISEGKEIRR